MASRDRAEWGLRVESLMDLILWDADWDTEFLPPDAPQELVVTYWGSDVGRKFDILIDGEPFASQTLELSKPNAFFDAHYALPAERLKGKTHIVVKFQAPARGLAGGIFGLRILKK